MSCFICPICGKFLEKTERAYICENSHNFDISKKGYVNLLMASGKGKTHGDDKPMLRARADFLNRGFYDRLSECVSGLVFEYTENGAMVLDAGCGEGKYTSDISGYLAERGRDARVFGVDISKDAVNLAASRRGEMKLAVASVADLPFCAKSVNALVSIFAPFFSDEFSRVLKDDGVAIRVYPLARHLWELKELLYETPYENPEPDMEENGFSVCEKYELKYKMKLQTGEDVRSLFAMTPYFYRTCERDSEKLKKVQSLECSAEFGIVVYKKKL